MPHNPVSDIQSILSSLVAEFALPDRLHDGQVELVTVSRREMQSLNHHYRSIDQPTDVLSFPLYRVEDLEIVHLAPSDVPLLLGTLVLCPPVIKLRAKEDDRSYTDQHTWSIRHGLLHLLGFDHPPDEERWQVGNVGPTR